MFINCPACRALVATDPATDLPPARCPRCNAVLREPSATADGQLSNSASPDGGQNTDGASGAAPDAAPEVMRDGDSSGVAQAGLRASAIGTSAAPVDRITGDGMPAAGTPSGDVAANRATERETPVRSLSSRLHAPLQPVDKSETSSESGVGPVPAAPAMQAPTGDGKRDSQADDRVSASDSGRSVSQTHAADNERHPTGLSNDALRTQIDAATPDAVATASGEASKPNVSALPQDRRAAMTAMLDAARAARIDDGTADAPADAGTTTAPHVDVDGVADSAPAIAESPAEERVISTASSPSATSLMRPTPSFAHARRRASAASGWPARTAVAGLAVLLALQLVLADRSRLAADASWRPRIEALCAVLRCSVPPWREPAALAMTQRDVRAVTGTPGVLRVTAVFRNDARWPQPLPRVRVALTDIDGNQVATRDFAPRDYADASVLAAGLAPGQTASMAVDVIEPAAASVAFDFLLH